MSMRRVASAVTALTAWQMAIVPAIGGWAPAEAAGPFAARCVLTLTFDDQSQRVLNLYLGNFIVDAQTQGLNASARYAEPATGELGVGTLELDPGTGALKPVRSVMKGSPPSGSATRERLIRFQGFVDTATGAMTQLTGDQSSLVTSGPGFGLQVRTFTGAGTCDPAEDP